MRYSGETWFDVYPSVLSIDGGGTEPLVIAMEDNPNCNGNPQYKWENIPISQDYICDECGEPTPYSGQYFTIESLEDENTIYFKALTSNTITISASTDNGNTWTAYTSSSGGNGTTIATLNTGDKVLVKGLNERYGQEGVSASTHSNHFKTTKMWNVYGNIMSLISGDSFTNATTLSSYAFVGLFLLAKKLVSAENLVLPATTLASYCYNNMFDRCTSLTTAPVLPATTLADYCYQYMFDGCSSLTTAPELPATTLAQGCYTYMFRGCTSLTSAPVLSATTLSRVCYACMFWNCSNLNYIKCLATDISAYNCTWNWVSGVQTTSGTFVKESSMSGWTTGNGGIPSGWTVQNA